MEYRLAVAVEFYFEKEGFRLESKDRYFKARGKDEAIKKAKRITKDIYRENKKLTGFLRTYASLTPILETIWYKWIKGK